MRGRRTVSWALARQAAASAVAAIAEIKSRLLISSMHDYNFYGLKSDQPRERFTDPDLPEIKEAKRNRVSQRPPGKAF
jgi:hypothetical protein